MLRITLIPKDGYEDHYHILKDETGTRTAPGLRVIYADGRDLANLAGILAGRPFVGTTIGPD